MDPHNRQSDLIIPQKGGARLKTQFGAKSGVVGGEDEEDDLEKIMDDMLKARGVEGKNG
jgi:hypothetical protein